MAWTLQDVKYSNVNSYATREYSAYIVIRNADDWKKFRTMVEDAKNQYWVDAVLDADISVNSKGDIIGYFQAIIPIVAPSTATVIR